MNEDRKLATIRTVDSVEPIEGADAIELAIVADTRTEIIQSR